MPSDDNIWTDLGWNHILESIELAGKLEVRVGVVGDAAQAPHPGTTLTVGEVAIINELGSENGHVPPRPFVKETFTKNEGEVARRLEEVARVLVMEDAEPGGALEALGAWAAEEVRKTIRSNPFTPNAPETLRQKEGSLPLVDTQVLIESIGFEVSSASPDTDYEEVVIGGLGGEG